MEKKPLVVVLSRNYSTGLGVIRSLGQAGYTIDLVANAHKEGVSEIASKSKYVRNYVEVVSQKVKDGDDEELLHELLKYENTSKEKIVLFPVDDYTASVMDMNRKRLSKTFLMPTIKGDNDGIMTRHMDKTVQGELARKAGLLTPKEWIISLADEIIIPEDMLYPCFCKPIESITGYKKEMAKCENEEELLKHLSKLKRKFADRSILVQEFLEIENEIDLSGVAFDDKVIIPAIIKKKNVAQNQKGVTLSGTVVPFEEMGDLQDSVCEMIRLFHYTGMFDMEFSIVGDKIYFNEVNLRSGGPNYAYFKSGINLPDLFVKHLMGETHSPEEETVDSYGKDLIYEKVAWDDYLSGYMTKKELKQCIEEAEISILYDDDDPEPQILFQKQIKRKAFRNKLRKIKKALKKTKRSIIKSIKKIFRPTVQIVKAYPQTKKCNMRNPDSEKPRVMVAGRNYCSNLCMARSLGKAGYEVEVMRIFQKRPKFKQLMKKMQPDAYSKYIKAYYICVSNRHPERIVNRLISVADPDRKMLLIPCDDLVAYIADDYMEELKDYYLFPNVNNKSGALINLMKKDVQKELAKEAGLPVINSCMIKTVGGEFTIPDTVNYPCFIKPNVSRNSSKGKMKKCLSREELFDTLTEYSAKKDIEFIVEDFVEISKEYSILGVSTKDGAIGPGFFVAEEGGQNEHRGVALIGRTLPCEDYQPLIDNINKFVGSLKFDGLYDVDLIETIDGKMYFVEINMRFGASGYAFTESGVNLPGMFADYMFFNKPIDFGCKVEETGKTFVSEKVLIEEYYMGRIPKEKIKSSLAETDIHFVECKDDPQAYKHFKKYYPVATATRIFHKFVDMKEEKKNQFMGS